MRFSTAAGAAGPDPGTPPGCEGTTSGAPRTSAEVLLRPPLPSIASVSRFRLSTRESEAIAGTEIIVAGGRIETVSLQDYADDVVSIVKWLAKREDVDPRRVTVAGYGEGGAVAMLAAARENKIGSLVLIATTGSTGAELLFEQQRHQLDLLQLPEAERQQKIDLQQKVHSAVMTDKGWESLPPDIRQQADTPWFRSVLQSIVRDVEMAGMHGADLAAEPSQAA